MHIILWCWTVNRWNHIPKILMQTTGCCGASVGFRKKLRLFTSAVNISVRLFWITNPQTKWLTANRIFFLLFTAQWVGCGLTKRGLAWSGQPGLEPRLLLGFSLFQLSHFRCQSERAVPTWYIFFTLQQVILKHWFCSVLIGQGNSHGQTLPQCGREITPHSWVQALQSQMAKGVAKKEQRTEDTYTVEHIQRETYQNDTAV